MVGRLTLLGVLLALGTPLSWKFDSNLSEINTWLGFVIMAIRRNICSVLALLNKLAEGKVISPQGH